MKTTQLTLNRGFTLVELLVAVSLLTFAHAWVVPSLAEMVESARVSSGAQAMSETLMRARSEAAKRNSRVVVCKSAAGSACEAASSWEQGWIVFHDVNNNVVRDPDEPLLHREPALASSVRLRGNAPVRNYVSYTPFGRTKLTSGAFQAGTFTVCSQRGKGSIARQVIINSGGRPRVAKATVSACT